jgi:hypothetical protein
MGSGIDADAASYDVATRVDPEGNRPISPGVVNRGKVAALPEKAMEGVRINTIGGIADDLAEAVYTSCESAQEPDPSISPHFL